MAPISLGLGLVQMTGTALIGSPPTPGTTETVFGQGDMSDQVAGGNEPGTAVTVGTVYYTTVDGTIKSILFYRFAEDATTTRDVRLYSMTRDGSHTMTEVGSGTTTGESGLGWVEAILDTPVAIQSLSNGNLSYVAVVDYPAGRYPFRSGVFNSDVFSPSGRIVGVARDDASVVAGGANGVYTYTLGDPPTNGATGGWLSPDIAFEPNI